MGKKNDSENDYVFMSYETISSVNQNRVYGTKAKNPELIFDFECSYKKKKNK
jgi:hypothetical protein